MKKFFAALVAALSLSGVAAADVHVNGTGSVPVTPDNAVISVVVTTNGDNTGVAVKSNAAEATKVFDMLKNTYKIADGDICTHTFSVNPVHEQDAKGNWTNRIASWNAVNYMTVTVRDTSKAGDILGAVGSIKGNAVQVKGIHFVVSDALRQKSLNEARQLAVKDAENRARGYVNTAGAELGLVKEIREQDVYIPQYRSEMATTVRGASMSDSVPVSAGSAKVNVTVQVSYGIRAKDSPLPPALPNVERVKP